MKAKQKNMVKLWERIRENWINGNREYVRTEMLVLSKRDLRRLVLEAITSGVSLDKIDLVDILTHLENVQ